MSNEIYTDLEHRDVHIDDILKLVEQFISNKKSNKWIHIQKRAIKRSW